MSDVGTVCQVHICTTCVVSLACLLLVSPVQRARMPAYVVPFTVLANIFCTKRASFETMAAVKWACIFSVICNTVSTSPSLYSVRTCKTPTDRVRHHCHKVTAACDFRQVLCSAMQMLSVFWRMCALEEMSMCCSKCVNNEQIHLIISCRVE